MVTNKIRIRVIAVILAMIATVAFSACGRTDAGKQGKAAGAEQKDNKPQPPTEISLMTTFFSQEAPDENNVVVKEIEKRTNTKLKITWVSPNNYNDKVNVTLASGDIPDLTLIQDIFHPQVRLMASQGAFWDVTSYLKDYKNLMTFPDVTWTNTKMADGKNYGIPRVRPVEGGGALSVRKDWLEKLNLKVPETIDEIYNTAKVFKDTNVAGKDTIPMPMNVDKDNMGALSWVDNVFYGTSGKWKLKGDQLVDMTLEPEAKKALAWMNKLYKEKLIPEDFSVMKTTQIRDIIYQSRGGIFLDTVNNNWKAKTEASKVDPKAYFISLPSIKGEGGVYANRGEGFNGMYVIPKKVPEAKFNKIMTFMDYGASDEGADLAYYGFKDVHYTEKDGFKIANEQGVKDNVSSSTFGQFFVKYDKYNRAYMAGITPQAYDENKKVIDAAAKVSIPNPAFGLFSETDIKLGLDFSKKIQDMKTKVIMGVETLDAWDSFAGKLKADAEYQKIARELNESYKKRSGK